jgi:hypothetical protein
MKGVLFGGDQYGYKNLPKIASTTIKHTIYRIEVGEKYSKDKAGMHIHKYMHKKHMGDLDKCLRTFIVIRDPVKRLISAFKSRVHFHNELSEATVKERFQEYYWDIPYFNPGLGQFVEHLEDYLKIKPIFHHCRPIVDFLDGQGLDYFSHVYKFENLSDFQRDLSDLVGRAINFPRSQTGGRKYFLRDLSKSQLEKLVEYYEEDYILLDGFYGIDELWREWRGESHDTAVPKTHRKMRKVKRYFITSLDKINKNKKPR